MSEVAVWSAFAYMNDDPDHARDERRELAEWQLQDWLRWATTRGYDNIYLSRDSETTRFERAPAPEGIKHGGLEAA